MRLERVLLSIKLPCPVSTLVAIQRGLETMDDYKPRATFMRQEADCLLIFEAVDTLKNETTETSADPAAGLH